MNKHQKENYDNIVLNNADFLNMSYEDALDLQRLQRNLFLAGKLSQPPDRPNNWPDRLSSYDRLIMNYVIKNVESKDFQNEFGSDALFHFHALSRQYMRMQPLGVSTNINNRPTTPKVHGSR